LIIKNLLYKGVEAEKNLIEIQIIFVEGVIFFVVVCLILQDNFAFFDLYDTIWLGCWIAFVENVIEFRKR
jgi:hypothetical protein